MQQIRRLQEHVQWLERKVKELEAERDEFKWKAMELAHIATWAAEQGNRKGLVSIKCATD